MIKEAIERCVGSDSVKEEHPLGSGAVAISGHGRMMSFAGRLASSVEALAADL
jgi:hypothetical protein